MGRPKAHGRGLLVVEQHLLIQSKELKTMIFNDKKRMVGAMYTNGLAALLVFSASLAASHEARADVLENGLFGDGKWKVNAQSVGDTSSLEIDPVGPLPLSSMIDHTYTYIDIGANGAATYLSNTVQGSQIYEPGPNCYRSAGRFAGANGFIDWTARACLPFNTQRYTVTLTFDSLQPLGTLRVISFLESAILGFNNADRLGVFGTPGLNNFRLLSIDGIEAVGFTRGASFNNSTNATYVGWAASDGGTLVTRILSQQPILFTPAGNIDTGELQQFNDPRYPGVPVYRGSGTSTPASAFAFDLNPAATIATISVYIDYQTQPVLFTDGFDPQ